MSLVNGMAACSKCMTMTKKLKNSYQKKIYEKIDSIKEKYYYSIYLLRSARTGIKPETYT